MLCLRLILLLLLFSCFVVFLLTFLVFLLLFLSLFLIVVIIIKTCNNAACERMKDDEMRLLAATNQLRRRPGPPVAPKTRSTKVGSVIDVPTFTAARSTAAGRPSSSLEDLAKPTTPALLPMPSVARQLIRDLERRQLQLRQQGILAMSEAIDTGGVQH